MSRGGKGLPRGPRLVNGEKRSATIKASVTDTMLTRIDAAAHRLGVPRSRYVEIALDVANQMVEAGSAPTGAMVHVQGLALAARSSLLNVSETVQRQIAALDMIALAADGEVNAAEVEARAA